MVFCLDRASAASIQPTSNRGINRANLVLRSEKNRARSAEEASLARILEDLPITEQNKNVNSGEYHVDALPEGNHTEIPLRNEINMDDIRRGAAIVS